MDELSLERDDAENLKRIFRMLERIERLQVPELGMNYYEVPFGILKRKAEAKEYFHTITICKAVGLYEGFYMRGVYWDVLGADVLQTIQSIEGPQVAAFPPKVQMEFDFESGKEKNEVARITTKERVAMMQKRNGQPAFPGKWRRMPYDAREYERITDYVATTTISKEEGSILLDQLNTPRDGFLGQAYNYDDNDLTEEWMVTFKDGDGKSGPSDDDVIRTNLGSLMEVMLLQVQDRVCNETGVLAAEPVGLGDKLKEAPVWGLDCYTRRMIELTIEDSFPSAAEATTEKEASSAMEVEVGQGGAPTVYAEPKQVALFIERYLLPAINAQAEHEAHNMLYALRHIVEKGEAPATCLAYARSLQLAVTDSGIENFRIHPKGTGVICTAPEGIRPHVMIAEYLGEAYPPYRWCERLDVIDQAQEELEIKPTLPDFWNILLERPIPPKDTAAKDPMGYGLIYVDASQKANLGSSCSHSCDSNTTSAVVARNGRLTIVLTTNRFVHYGEELTMDYSSITTSDVEWRAAVCLCGKMNCRGSFLHYATQDDLQQVLTQNCGTLWRYASLLKACSSKPTSPADILTMQKHGMMTVAMGEKPKAWATKFAADNLRFVEFERKALPCALMRSNKKGESSGYTFAAADMDARSVMEQRLQSLVCCFSMTGRVLPNQPDDKCDMAPLRPLASSEAASGVWAIMQNIPELLRQHVLPSLTSLRTLKTALADVSTNKGTSDADDMVTEVDETMQDVRGRVVKAISDVQSILNESAPSNMREIRSSVLRMRTVILQICDLSSPLVRLQLLCDMLVLWANTTHFSCVNLYEPVKSGPIDVIARDIGSCIRRGDLNNAKAGKKASASAKERPHREEENDSPRDIANGFPFEQNQNQNETLTQTKSQTQSSPSFQPLPPSMPISSSSSAPTSSSLPRSSSSPPPPSASAVKKENPNQAIVPALEVVFTGARTYQPLFTFHTLMNWFDAGTDTPIGAPDVFGCCMLPLPSQCFGQCASQHGYTHKQRASLLKIIGDEKLQSKPWPEALKACFTPTEDFKGYFLPLPVHQEKGKGSNKSTNTKKGVDVPVGRSPLFGSPMLDVALGQVQAVVPVQQELLGHAPKRSKKSIHMDDSDDEAGGIQFDSILPPEIPTDWVQCEGCRKWRRVAWHVDMDALPDEWRCSMNTWEPADASCDVPQDSYDPESESTLQMGSAEPDPPLAKENVGEWRDVFCLTNRVYYEAKLVQHRINPKSGKAEIKTHFKGWNSKFDEWIPCDSDRVRPHNLMTDPVCKDIRHQAEWQGNFKLHKAESSSRDKGKENGVVNGKGGAKGKVKSTAKGKGRSSKTKGKTGGAKHILSKSGAGPDSKKARTGSLTRGIDGVGFSSIDRAIYASLNE